MHYTTSCNTQSSAPEDGKNNCPKRVALTGIINKPSLLHLGGCLYYLWVEDVCIIETLFFSSSSPDIVGIINSRSIKQSGYMALMAEKRNHLGKPQSRCEFNLLYLQKLVCGVVEWINVAWDRAQWQP